MVTDSGLIKLCEELRVNRPQRGEYDIAEWNLLLASGLPGSENLNVDALLDKLDGWTAQVRRETERGYCRFLQNPAEFDNSQGTYCVLVLITVLERDLGVRYNPARITDPTFQDPHSINPDFTNSADLFIHGMLDGPGGTCASMPILYTAVGRRLGYPMKLVEAPGHLFSRWDDLEGKFNGVKEYFNIGAAGRGFVSHSDDHYRRWPRPWTEIEQKHDWYLKSLTTEGEIAAMLATRGACLEDNKRLGEAFMCFHWAYQLTKDKRYYQQAAYLQHQLQECQKEFWRHLEQIEELNRQQWQRLSQNRSQPMRTHEVADVGHGPSCQCAHCKRERPQVLAKMNGDFGHGTYCQCFHCSQNRQLVKTARSPFGPHFP